MRVVLRASHDGYADRFGVVHQRALMLAHDGTRLDGEDLFVPADGDILPAHSPTSSRSASICIRRSRPTADRRPRRHAGAAEPRGLDLRRLRGPRRARGKRLSRRHRRAAPHRADRDLRPGAQGAARALELRAYAAPARAPPQPRRRTGTAAEARLRPRRRECAATAQPATFDAAMRRSHDRHLRRVARALLSVSDKTGLVDFARGARRPRRRARLDRRHRQGARGRRPGGDRRVGAHRLSRDDGRPGQDAASRRCMAACSRSATTRSTPAAMEAHGIAADRSPGGQPLSVRGDGGEGRRLRRLHREHRHRRAGDDPRRRQEPRRRRGGGRARRLRRGAGRARRSTAARPRSTLRQKLAAKAYARTAAYDAAISNWFAATLGRAGAGVPRLRRASSPRRCATARTRTRRAAFYRTPEQRAGRRHRAPGAGQGALLQQHQRHRRGL